MIIKSPKENRQIVMLIFVFAVIVFALFGALSDFNDLVLPILASSFIIILNIRFWITYDRILELNENGCTVKFMCFSKTYRWSELKIKNVVDCKNAIGGIESYELCVIFSTKHKNPRWLLPSVYGFFAHPFSFIFIYFDPHFKYGKWIVRKNPESYVVEKDEFLKKMAEWNIEIINRG